MCTQMRTFKLTAYATLAALGVSSLVSCDKFLNINQDPNSILVAPSPNVLVAAETGLGFAMGSDLHRFTSLIAQQFSGQGGAGTQTAEYDRYNITATDINNLWRSETFAGNLADMQKLIAQTQDASPAYSGIAKIMKAYELLELTDTFGDIPYSQALLFDQNFAPVYDKSDAVYTGLITLLNDGIADIKKTSSVIKPGNDDLIYGGDLGKWERAANTIKLRIYLHYFPKVSSNSNADMATLVGLGSGSFILSNADNFQLRFEASANHNNPIDQFEKSRNNTFFPSATFVNLMNAKNDPRRPFFLTNFPVGSTTYVGAPNGTGAVGAPNPNFSRMNTYLRGTATGGTGFNNFDGTAPIRMLTFAEYNFILAEYYARTGNLLLAQTSYVAGITASMNDAGVASADRVTYLASRPVLTAGNAVQSIIEEKFIANFGVAVEPWTDYRRTKFPVLTLPANTNGINNILRILPYSDIERTSNANTPPRTDLTAPSVFWDPGM